MVFILSFYRSFSFYRLFGHRVVSSARSTPQRVLVPASSLPPLSSFASRISDLYSMNG